jgi:hypothetical protein
MTSWSSRVEYDGFVLPGGATSMFGGFPRL